MGVSSKNNENVTEVTECKYVAFYKGGQKYEETVQQGRIVSEASRSQIKLNSPRVNLTSKAKKEQKMLLIMKNNIEINKSYQIGYYRKC